MGYFAAYFTLGVANTALSDLSCRVVSVDGVAAMHLPARRDDSPTSTTKVDKGIRVFWLT